MFSYLRQYWALQGLCLRFYTRRSSYPGLMQTVLKPDHRAERTHEDDELWHHALLFILHLAPRPSLHPPLFRCLNFREGCNAVHGQEWKKRKPNGLTSPACLKGIQPSSGPSPIPCKTREILRHVHPAHHDLPSSLISTGQALASLGLTPTLTPSPTLSFPLWGFGTCVTSALRYTLTSSRHYCSLAHVFTHICTPPYPTSTSTGTRMFSECLHAKKQAKKKTTK